MQGNEKIIAMLNQLLTHELTAINQYMVHSSMSENWGYEKLHQVIEKRAIDEMKHAERLIDRILFLEGIPVVSVLDQISIGAEVNKQHQNDRATEADAIQKYNGGIELAVAVGDNGTRELLGSILKEEEAHIDVIEAQLEQMNQMGIQHYLAEQIS